MAYNPALIFADGQDAFAYGYCINRNPYRVASPAPRGMAERAADWAAGWHAAYRAGTSDKRRRVLAMANVGRFGFQARFLDQAARVRRHYMEERAAGADAATLAARKAAHREHIDRAKRARPYLKPRLCRAV